MVRRVKKGAKDYKTEREGQREGRIPEGGEGKRLSN